MPVSSMTGFGRAAGAEGACVFEWELRSVNGRGLECRFRAPPGFDASEAQLRAKTQARFARGNINASLQIKRQAAFSEARLNTAALDRLHQALSLWAKTNGLAPPELGALIGLRGVIDTDEPGDTPEDQAALSAAVFAAFDDALAALAGMRQSEGAALHETLTQQLAAMETLVAGSEALRAGFADVIRERLRRQVETLIESSDRFDPARLHQEAVLIAARADIREELDRLKAHIAAARGHLAADGPAGRKLDFLSQEFMREANTLCSKSPDTALTALGLELKNVIEQFREQVQNVE